MEPNRQPVDRARRATFISYVVGGSICISTGIVAAMLVVNVDQIYLPIIEMFISGLLSLSMATTLAYVGGSVVDYNGGVRGLLNTNKTGNKG